MWRPHRQHSWRPLVTQFSIHNVFTFPLHLTPSLLRARPSVSYSAEKVVQEHHLLVSTQQCESEAACRVEKGSLCHCCGVGFTLWQDVLCAGAWRFVCAPVYSYATLAHCHLVARQTNCSFFFFFFISSCVWHQDTKERAFHLSGSCRLSNAVITRGSPTKLYHIQIVGVTPVFPPPQNIEDSTYTFLHFYAWLFAPPLSQTSPLHSFQCKWNLRSEGK